MNIPRSKVGLCLAMLYLPSAISLLLLACTPGFEVCRTEVMYPALPWMVGFIVMNEFIENMPGWAAPLFWFVGVILNALIFYFIGAAIQKRVGKFQSRFGTANRN